jgi:hypothetical protein
MLDIDAYAADWRMHGQIEPAQVRLSDELNASDELHIRDARFEDLADGHQVVVSEITVGQEELCAVVASGPRGEEARRLTTKTSHVEVEIGPYRIVGWVHSPRGGDPVGSVLRRGAWVPLTDVTVFYLRSGENVRDRVPTLLVNRNLMRAFREV